jgi:hypothetical protein
MRLPSYSLGCSCAGHPIKFVQAFNTVSVFDALIPSPSQHPWESQGKARLMPLAWRDRFKSYFKDHTGFDNPYRPKLLASCLSNPGVDLTNLRIT